MTNEDDSIDGTIKTLAKGQTKEGSKVKGHQREHLSDVGGTGHFATNNHGNDIDNDDNKDDNDDNYDDGDDGGGASDYEVGRGGAGVTGGNDGDGVGVGGHANGEGDDDDVVVYDSGGNGDRGGVEGGLVNKGDDKSRNGAYLSENGHCDGNGIAMELDSDHELVATAEDRSEETILVSNTFPLSVH